MTASESAHTKAQSHKVVNFEALRLSIYAFVPLCEFRRAANLIATWQIPVYRFVMSLFSPSSRFLSWILFAALPASGPIAFAEERAAEPVPCPRAHAHNDYYHKRPLEDALSHGFCSVEADVYFIGGRLLVAHSILEIQPDKTLEKLYLDPLLKRVRQNARDTNQPGRVFADGPAFTLMIDIKQNGPKVYARLQKVLPHYQEMLTRVEDGKLIEGAVRVIISGDRPQKQIRESQTRYVGIDGRLSDLDSKQPAHLLPLISDRWTSHFKWRGAGPMPSDEKLKLKKIVRQAHDKGRRVRFWATPENKAVWQELYDADVDLMNTDRLAELQKFLASQKP